MTAAPASAQSPASPTRALDNVEGLCSLSPVQEGMLFHSLEAPGSGVYVNQLRCRLEGDLEPGAFRGAWAALVEHHQVLRAAVLWEGLKRPVMVVRRAVPLPLVEEDWRSLAAEQQAARFDELCAAQRRRGFELARAPLMRLHLVRVADAVHLLVWTHHHLILDGWSLALLLRDFGTAYGALAAGRSPELPPARPFLDYLRWVEARDLGAAEGWLRRALAGLEGPTPLPIAAPTTQEEPGRLMQGELRRSLSEAETADLEALARRLRVTSNVLVEGLWALLLARWSGEDEVVFGVAAAGRPPELAGAEAMVGLFINTLPLRVRVARGEPLATWLQGLLREQAELRQHEHTPLSQVQRWSGLAPGTALFESLYVFENYPLPSGRAGARAPLSVVEPTAWESTNYPLNLMVLPGQRLTLKLIHDRERCPTSDMSRLLAELLTLLSGALARPEARLGELPYLPAAERHALLFEANDRTAPVPGPGRVHAAIAAQAAQRPEAIALGLESEQWSHGALDELAGRLAGRLRRQGVGLETRVAVRLPRSAEMLVSLLAVMKAGGTYVPIDPGFPEKRRRFMLEDSSAALVLDQLSLAELAASAPAPALAELAEPWSLLYLIYTSGSTGVPKGVGVTHGGVVNFLRSMERELGLGPADRLVAVTTLSFDIAVLELFGPLVVGGRVELATEEVATSASLLAERLATATLLQATPATWRLLLDGGWAGEPGLLAVCGGEALPPPLARALVPRCRQLWNLYGPTETTVWSARARLRGDEAIVPIGRPLANTSIHLVSRTLELAPLGGPGEIVIGGLGVARGYHGRPRLTAERFVPDPWSGQPGARLYRTGDLGRRLPDDSLAFVRRLDEQVKVRGYRIETGEVERTLAAHPGLRAAVVLAVPDPAGDSRLIAYLVAAGEPPPAAELRRFVAESLPAYMVPAAFVFLDELPLTPNGKIDRRRLPAAGLAPAPGRPRVPPRTPTEEAVAALWCEQLGLRDLGVDDHFFEVGGHSLAAIRLIGRIRKRFDTDLPFHLLLAHPTVEGMARLLDERRGRSALEASPAEPSLTAYPEQAFEPFPLTDLQEAYWVGASGAFELGGVSPLMVLEYDLPAVDPARLESAVARWIAQHPMLRARLLPDGRQQVAEAVPPYRLRVQELATLGEAAAEAELEGVRRQMAGGLDLERWPLFELRLCRLAGERCRLHLAVSLAIADAMSLRVLVDDLVLFYLDPGREPSAQPLSFRDYVLGLAALEGGTRWERDRRYWEGRLAGLPPAPELPLARSPGALSGHRLSRASGTLAAEPWRRLKERAGAAGLSPSLVLCAVYCQVIATWSKSPWFTLNLLFFNRPPEHPELERVVGNFSTTLLFEVDCRPRESFLERARRLQARLWEDLDHATFSGTRVLRELNRRDASGPRAGVPVVFTSALDIGSRLDAERERAELAELGREARLVTSGLQTPQVWLDHQVGEAGGVLGYNFDFVEELFPPGLPADLVGAYAGLLERLATDETAWTERLAALTPPAHRALAFEMNRTQGPLPGGLLTSGFAARLAERWEQPAVISPERTLRYGELATEALALAGQLRAAGVGRGRRVVVAVGKGWRQGVAVLAVLQAGGAYVPVDPELPAERLDFLLSTVEPEVVLVEPGRAGSGLGGGRPELAVGVEAVAPALDRAAVEAAWRQEAADPGDLAYVIFTSGSTGQPKGVMIDHRAAVNTVAEINRRFAVGPEDRVLGLSALGFDLSVYDLFGLLAAGGALVLPDAAGGREPAHWLELLEGQRVTLWNTVPALLEMLVDELEGRERPLPASLRTVLLSGDWIPVTLPDRLRALGPAVEVVSLGGATEAAIWSIAYPIGEVDPAWPSIPYGRPLANQTFQVLDEQFDLRPIWVPGQLFIGGVGLAQGYWRDEEKTSRSFFRHPETGERLYRTGDLGRLLPDGNLEFLGREDLQVKVQGYRIELAEIESALTQHPGLKTAAVLAEGERRGAKRLVAYVVAEAEPAPAAEELAGHLAAKLPRYMVPASFVFLPALPLTANGKVDRPRLSALAPAPGGETVSAAPVGELEGRLATLWAEILGRGSVGATESFFEQGGNSLLAVRLIGRIRRELGADLPLSVLFERPTLRQLAAALGEGAGAASRPALVTLTAGGSRPPLFLVHAVGGGVLGYSALARRLGPEQPLFAFETPPELATEGLTVEALATRYLEELLRSQPAGPYRLGGWSMGGVIAFEMAGRLLDRGAQVERLVLLDSDAPALEPPVPKSEAELEAWFAADAGLVAAEEASEVARLFATFRANARALERYRPLRRALPVWLINAADELARGKAAERGWERWTSGAITISAVAGDHHSFLAEPRVAATAACLAALLAAS